MSAVVIAGGQTVLPTSRQANTDQVTAKNGQPSAAAVPLANHQPTKPEQVATPSRAIDPEIVAPPPVAPHELQRIAPRAPLSDLALAGPPAPQIPGNWDGTTLFRPIAPAAGIIEAKGHSVAIAGIDPVKPAETCLDGETSWKCGLRARTAFRAFLRGRGVVCALPSDAKPTSNVAKCRVGKVDIGTWLASNGWGRAAAGGPYEELGKKAREAKKGIFGFAPDLSGLPSIPASTQAVPEAPASIIDLSGMNAMPPIDQPEPVQ